MNDDSMAPGDLLLFRRSGVVGRAIAAAGRSVYSHAAMLGQWGNEWLVLEVREFYGGRIVTLDSQVRRFSGKIDVFRLLANPPFVRPVAVAWMRRYAGCDYGWLSVCLAAMRHFPLVRWAVPIANDDIHTGRRPPFCSQAVAMAYRWAGMDPVPQLADRLTEPADLARSACFEYQFTLEQ